MSRIFDKLTTALGFKSYDDEDEYEDEYDQYDEDEDYEEEPRSSSRSVRSSRSSSRSASSSRYDSSSRYNSSPSRYESSRQGSYSSGYSSPRYEQSQSRYESSSQYEQPERREVSRVSYSGSPTIASSYSRSRNSKVVNLNANVQMEVVVASPETIEEAKDIAQNMKDKKPVVINLEFVEQPDAQRITDFLCGCCYALNGNVQRIAQRIFMIAPDNVDFAGDLDIRERLKNESTLMFPWQDN